MVEIICAAITGVSTICVALIGVSIKKTNKRAELKEKRRSEESMLSLQMMSATLELSEACCIALTGGTNNGNVEKAREKTDHAKAAYLEFQRRLVAEELA